jgi:enediyne biosynthesis protein E4
VAPAFPLLYNNGVIARSAVVLSTFALLAACSSSRTERPSPNGADRAATSSTRPQTADAARPDEAPESTAHDRISTATPSQADWFTDRAVEAGLDFVHFNGASGEFFYPEILPPGVALFDYDNDGDLDVYVVQGQMLGAAKSLTDALLPPAARSLPLRGRLYRNDLQVREDGTRVLHFTDVTERSGIDARQYGLGVATGDIDNDGCIDLLLTNFGTNQLYHNNCDGTFSDVSRQSGIEDKPGVAVAAAFLDFDRDGWLDLFVGYNVNYTLQNRTQCPNVAGVRDYCPPRTYGGQPGRLYRNLGHGKFVDVTGTALLGGNIGPALGVSTADFNGDGWIDIYVANDGVENLLWINQRNGTFKETALLAGAAVNELGKPEASMGVDAGDFDNDGDEDLFFTNLTGEGHDLLANDGKGQFEDISARAGIASASLPYTGFGTAWLDFDNDGLLDILTVNGKVALEGRASGKFPYDQRKQLFHNLGNGRFEDVTDRAGKVFALSEVGRGAAFGDIDNDGDTDVVVANNGGPLRLLVNNLGNRSHWLGLRLVGEHRDMLGATVAVMRRDGPTLWRRARADGSYASANDPRVLVGLGRSTEKPTLRVRWPDGSVEVWSDVPIDCYTTLTKGRGKKRQ